MNQLIIFFYNTIFIYPVFFVFCIVILFLTRKEYKGIKNKQKNDLSNNEKFVIFLYKLSKIYAYIFTIAVVLYYLTGTFELFYGIIRVACSDNICLN